MQIKYSILFIILFIIAGCTYIPSTTIHQAEKLDNMFFLRAESASGIFGTQEYIRLYDDSKNTWENKISFNDNDFKEATIRRLHINNGKIIADLGFGCYCRTKLYVLNTKGEIESSIIFKWNNKVWESFVGLDNDFFYSIEKNFYDDSGNYYFYKGVKYDRFTNSRITHHFANNENLIVRDIHEDEDKFWYFCINEDGKPHSIKTYKEENIVILTKSKINNVVEEFYYDDCYWWSNQDNYTESWVTLDCKGVCKKYINCNKSLKSDEYLNKLAILHDASDKYSYNPYTSATLCTLFSTSLKNEGSEKDNSQIMDKCKLYDKELKEEGLKAKSILFTDDDTILIYAEKVKHPLMGFVGEHIPYLIRFDKNNMNYEMILVSPTLGDASMTVIRNFCWDVGFPIFSLGFGLVMMVFGGM